MKTVILSGGLGYRLKEETEFKPKPMVNVGNKPILWHIMKIYAHYGFNDFIIALGYKGDYIKDYFINQRHFAHNFTIHTKSGKTDFHKVPTLHNSDDFKITFVDTGEDTLPGERILRVQDFIPATDDNFMVTYGDGLSNIDIKELVNFHKKHNKIGTVTGVHPRSKYGLLSWDEKTNLVKEFVEKPVLKDRVNGGFMVFKREFFDYLKSGEMEHEAIKRLVKKQELALFVHDGFWHAMDTYPDVEALNKSWMNNPEWKVWKK